MDNEINPDVLGYIFEKYINQKAFGAYYTRPEITEYLCERSIHRIILARINLFLTPLDLLAGPRVKDKAARRFYSLADLLLNLDAALCRELLFQVLPDLKLLDPACGSGAFLVAAMKTLINIYSAVIGRIKFLNDKGLAAQLTQWETEHQSLSYFIKRRIITDNLFGVDIMEEATEIAKLRLFLALVASAQTVEQLEPLPNIDFNILAGNSLIGLIKVDAKRFDIGKGEFGGQIDLFRKSYGEVLEEKNRLVDVYRHTASWAGSIDLSSLKAQIEEQKAEAQETLNELLLHDWHQVGIRFEAATWDLAKGKDAKPKKRKLQVADIEALQPFHWGFEFDEILNQRGGFDAIITNPPWEIFKPNGKEFFQEHSDLVSKNKMTIQEFEKEKAKLLKDREVRAAWLDYLSRFPHVNAWFRTARQYAHQAAQTQGKKIVTDLNLYKLFLEQCVHLLRPGGESGIVIPSGIYTDLGTKELRQMLFDENAVTGLVGFENRKEIFEGVHRSFKFVVLTFKKGGETASFPAAFMRLDVADLACFPTQIGIPVSLDLVRRLSPDSLSIAELRSPQDVAIVDKLYRHPLLGEPIPGAWNLLLGREFHMTDDKALFETAAAASRWPLFEGKMIWQFDTAYDTPRYWVPINAGQGQLRTLAAKRLTNELKQSAGLSAEQAGTFFEPTDLRLDHECYRLAFRDIAASTNERTMIAAVLPRDVFAGNTLNLSMPWRFEAEGQDWQQLPTLGAKEMLYLTACLDSFVVD